jgi:hypothetical protein
MTKRNKLPKIDIYQEELTELYHDCLRSDGFDCDAFKDKLSCHLKAAQIDSIDLHELESLMREVASSHWDLIEGSFKKAA